MIKSGARRLRSGTTAILKMRSPKVFCISMQRSGTTSVGRFLRDHGYRVAGYGTHSVEWSQCWHRGDFEAIFNCWKFKTSDGFEDNPWWYPDFYRVLSYRFPTAKFILLYRDSDKWFDSMLNHSLIGGLSHGEVHSRVYGRMLEYYQRKDAGQLNDPEEAKEDLPLQRSHYQAVYSQYNRGVIEFFDSVWPGRLVHGRLEDPQKWRKIAEFLSVDILNNYDTHQNASVGRATEGGMR